MKEIDRILDQLRRAYDGDAWHGPPLRKLLQDVGPEQAAARPVPGAHTIWELVGHISAWQNVVRRRLGGEAINDLPDEQNWPQPAKPSAALWQRTLDALAESHRRFQEAASALSDDQLDRPALGSPTAVYVLLHGVVQHNLYHAGQIALLKKIPTSRA